MWMWFVAALPLWFWGKPVDPGKVPPELMAEARTPYRILQFPGPIQDAWREALQARGVKIYSYIKENAYLVRMPEGVSPEAVLTGLPVVRNLPYHPAWKMEPEIGTRQFQNPERVKDGRWWLAVDAFPDADLFAVVDALEKAGAWIETWTETSDPVVKRVWVRIPKDRKILEAIAKIPGVWLVRERLEYVKLNDRNRWVLQGNVQNPMDTTVWSHGIHGEDQVVAVMDSDLNENRCWFSGTDYAGRPKVISNAPAPGSPTGTVDYCNACEHGTHVAGTVLGKTTGANAAYNGLAYEARLIFQDVQAGCGSAFLDIPSSLIQALTDALNNGARVHTNSWGSSSNSYTTYSQDFDDFLFANQEFLVTVAMGNSSSAGASEDGTIGSPATAKNVTSIGATYHPPDQDTRAYYSSQGPTYDGRIKPDVMAPGGDASANQTNSADESQTCGVCQMSGTSMATPAVAGAAALVFQYFEKGYYPSGTATPADAFTPLGSLVKAMLVNSAEPMVNEPAIPNSEVGWGRVRLRNVLYFPGDSFKLFVVNATNGPTTGQTLTYTISVDQGYPLKVTLAWYDAAGSNLVNNLDLEVVDPNGTVYRGNVFSNGWSTTGGTADNLNTVEAVRIQNPTPGTWTIRVKGTNVPTPASTPYSGQPFGLVATYKELALSADPKISVSPDTVVMNTECKGVVDSVGVTNLGTPDLVVNNITSSNPRILVQTPPPITVLSTATQYVRFQVDTAGLIRGYLPTWGTLYFYSNDPTPDPDDSAIVKIVHPYPYDPAQDYASRFATNGGGWTAINQSGNGTGWQWGTPSGTDPTSPTGTNVWATTLGGNYATDLADWRLEMTVYRGYYCGTPMLIMTHWYDIETGTSVGYDGGNVKYSLDGGNTWNLLRPRRGYDMTISTSYSSPIAGEEAFTGNSGGWITDTFDLTVWVLSKDGRRIPVDLLASPGDSLRIRIQFASDNSVNNFQGWYIDEIKGVGVTSDLALTVGDQNGAVSSIPPFQLSSPVVSASRALEVQLNLTTASRVTVELYDAAGRKVRTLFQGVVSSGQHAISAKLSRPGLYFVRTRIGDKTYREKVVVVR